MVATRDPAPIGDDALRVRITLLVREADQLADSDPQRGLALCAEALALAAAGDSRADQARCHRALAEIYRRQGAVAQALAHFEQFHQIERDWLDEEAAARAQAIVRRHESEVAQREAAYKQAYAESLQHQLAERDLSARRMAQLNQRLLFHVQQTPLGYIEWDLNTHVVTWNRAAEQIFGYSAEEVQGRRIRDLIVPERLWEAIEALRADLSRNTGGGRRINPNRTKAGREIICEWHNTPLLDDSGAAIGWAALVQDITEQVETREQLQRVNEALSQRNAELDAYARTVAHDLKNLLTSLLGAAQILSIGHERLSPYEIGEYVKIIGRSGDRAVRVIDDLLLLARPDSAPITIAPVEMGALLKEAMAQLDLLVSQYQATIALPDSWPLALGYGPWIESVWMNYISNALKYGGQPPQVELGATPSDGAMIRFWVRDNGAGLSDAQLTQLFTEFQRFDITRAPGHGIGLAIVQRVITRLGGRVGAESAPGQGSTFWFTLPAAHAGSPPPGS